MTGMPPEVMTHKLNEECQQALKNLKAYLSNIPLLAKPKDGERLFVYLVVSEMTVNAFLIREDKGRLAKWAIELSDYDIMYQPRTAIKSQVLAYLSTKIVPEVEKELQIFTGSNPGMWTLFTDGSSNIKGADLGIVLILPSGESIRQAVKYCPITNNEAECEALIPGLELARELSIEQIVIKSDSQLVVNQMQGTYITREARMMQQYLEKARELIRQFQSWKIVQIPREENAEADALANIALVAEITSAENVIVIYLFHSVLDQDKNEIIINNLKKRLEESKGNWLEVLPGVLWAYRTTTKTGTREIPFSLVYGSEALIPVEIGEPSTRFTQVTEESNDEELRTNLDVLEQRKEAVLIRMVEQKQTIERYYNMKAHLRYFKIGDFILKSFFQSTKSAGTGKLNPNWEGIIKFEVSLENVPMN
ncbi:uncharacterized protein LOC142167346 [Nicotiana tabacum]|uniref:Uncharacterized protein LOC142167346 n=1 Tax=Nicotiana tabacum TaxID=4097 RepID=A0AC58SF61_TOBAC